MPERKQETHEKLSRAARKAAAAKRKRDQQQQHSNNNDADNDNDNNNDNNSNSSSEHIDHGDQISKGNDGHSDAHADADLSVHTELNDIGNGSELDCSHDAAAAQGDSKVDGGA